MVPEVVSPERSDCGVYIADFAAGSNAARASCVRPAAPQIWRSTIFSLSSAMASAGLRPFGQALVQFMMVWQR